MLATLKAIRCSPENGGLVTNNLCFRYNVRTAGDGLTGEEGTFSICTFWLVEAMARAGRYDEKILEQALVMFEQMIGYSNHLGLYSEQIAKTGQALGNFPQAFTHLAVISAAFNLDRILG
jgi:GH15 family glucan-1,4-alpha-glucosidase